MRVKILQTSRLLQHDIDSLRLQLDLRFWCRINLRGLFCLSPDLRQTGFAIDRIEGG